MQIERKVFLERVSRVEAALPSSSKLPAFMHVWFTGEHVHAYDGGLGIRAELKTDFELGVPGKPLLGLLAGTVAEKVDLTYGKRTGLGVKMGRSNVTMAILPADMVAWPFPKELPKKAATIEITQELLDAWKKLLVINTKPTRVEHFGITVFPIDGGAVLFATDSHALAMVTVDMTLPKEAEKIVLPRAFVVQMVEHCPPGEKLKVLADCMIATGDGVMLYSNMLDNAGISDLPKMVERFTTGEEAKFAVPKELGVALKRAELLAGSEEEAALTLTIADDDSLLLFGSYKLGELSETLDLETKKVPAGELTVELEQLQIVLPLATEFALSENALVVFGEGNFMCILPANKARKS